MPTVPSLRRAVLRGLRVPAAFAVGAATALVVSTQVLGGLPGAAAQSATTSAAAPERSAADPRDISVQRLVALHGCWWGEAPADMRGVLPGHVVVTTRLADGAEQTTYGGAELVGRALDHLFTAPDPGLESVHAFCR